MTTTEEVVRVTQEDLGYDMPIYAYKGFNTQGRSGIGRATAELFAKKGAAVVIAGRRATEGEDTITAIHEAGGVATFVQADVTTAAEVRRLVDVTVQTYGRLDYAFNNAGAVGPMILTAECSDEDWHAVLAVNLTGVWLCMKHEILQMLKNGGGVIVNMSSMLGLSVNPLYGPAYAASKHGVVGLTKLAAVQYAQHNIRINAVCPGVIHTPMAAPVLEDAELEARVVSWHPLGRVGESGEVAEAVVWLCSESASFITGHALPVDGGAIAKF
jgi:NAD(P)-dependent dehydrogenase (short-subunit alcohol dehydrogenase family)